MEGRESTGKAFTAYVNVYLWQWTPAMIDEWLGDLHVQQNESDPKKRVFTKAELHAFFAHCDNEVARIRAFGRKGWLPAFRDATLFKTAYAFGLFSGAPLTCVPAFL